MTKSTSLRRTRTAALLAGGLLVATGALIASPAQADQTTQWGAWDPLSGGGGAYSGQVQIAALPEIDASFASDARAQSQLVSGASTWLSPDTPVGQKYGSSRDQPYLNLRPAADNATSPSTTTYTFSRPTPTAGWTFVLGDIDADMVRITATGPDGSPLSTAQLGFRGGFNYCAPDLAQSPSCTGDAADVPTWDPSTGLLTGNTAAVDTNGAAAWFEPTAPISTLTFEFTRRSGFPVYQTWFAALARDISGTVTAETGSPEGVVLELRDASGAVLASTTSDSDGAYSFTGVQASSGYTVTATPPTDREIDGPEELPIDLTDSDGIADFALVDAAPPVDPDPVDPDPSAPDEPGDDQPPAEQDGMLAPTGADPTVPLAIAGGLLLVGAIVLIVARLRRRP